MPSITSGISKEKMFGLIGYEPHSANQWAAHNSDARFRIPCCGRRWGKSTFAAHEMTAAMFIPDSYYWICGPDYSLGEKEFRIVYNDIIRKLDMRNIKGIKVTNNPKQGDMSIRMPWNTVLEVKSAQKKDGLVGEGLDGLIVAEAARHDRDTWEMYLEPALSDKRGWAIFPSTPRGYNWYQGLWELGRDKAFPDYQSWRFPTWSNSAMFPMGYEDPEMVRIRSLVSKSFWLQEYAAEFTAFEGQIYEDFDFTIHVQDIEYNPDWKNYNTLDFGFRDPFVCLDIMVDPSDNIYIWREYMYSGMSTWEHGQFLINRKNPQGYHIDGIYADPNGADEIATLQPMMGFIIAPKVPWIQGIESIQRLIKLKDDGTPSLYIDRSCKNTIRQLSQLRHAEVREGINVRREGQHDYDDHGPDALRYFTGPYFVMGANSHLSDVYSPDRQSSEAATFFSLQSGFTRDTTEIPWYGA